MSPPTTQGIVYAESGERTCAGEQRGGALSVLVAQLEHDTYCPEGSQPLYRAGWTDAMRHAIRIVRRMERAERMRVALHELAACDVEEVER